MSLDTQETVQRQLVYITNLEKDLQNHGTEMNKAEGPKDKKPAVKNRPLERPSLINLNHGSKIYEESGSENDNMEEIKREKNMKNMKEIVYTNISGYKSGEWAEQQKIKKPKNDHQIPRNQEKNEKALVTKERTLSNLGKNIFIGDSEATSHMTTNKMGVYNLTPIKGSVMIGNGQSIMCTHKGKLDVICKHKDGSMAKETWDVKIVPQPNDRIPSTTPGAEPPRDAKDSGSARSHSTHLETSSS